VISLSGVDGGTEQQNQVASERSHDRAAGDGTRLTGVMKPRYQRQYDRK